MRLAKSTVGLASILGGLILTRIALHFSQAPAGMDPLRVWRAMGAGPKASLLAGAALLVYGLWTLLKAVAGVLGRRRGR
jgi:hypothetical protein